jgi:glutamyl-tRNA reductase
VARAEAEKTIATLGGPTVLGEKGEKALKQMADSIINKLLHTPLMALKTPDGEEAEALVQATRRLFALPEDRPADGAASGEANATEKRTGGKP